MKLTLETINHINLFEKLTGARIKDCFVEDGGLVFLVEEGNMQKALGKNNSNVYRVERVLKKKIRLLAYSSDPVKFIKNLLYPIKADKIEMRDGEVQITAEGNVLKGKIFGRSKSNLERISKLLKKYHNIKEVKVV